MNTSPKPGRTTLARVEIFRTLPDADKDALALFLRVGTCHAGDVVFRQGDPGSSVYLVAEGALLVTVRLADGREVPIGEVQAGEVVGEMAFLDPAPRTATVVASRETTLFELGQDAMATLRRQLPRVAHAVVAAATRDVARRLRALHERIHDELARSNERRVGGAS